MNEISGRNVCPAWRSGRHLLFAVSLYYIIYNNQSLILNNRPRISGQCACVVNEYCVIGTIIAVYFPGIGYRWLILRLNRTKEHPDFC